MGRFEQTPSESGDVSSTAKLGIAEAFPLLHTVIDVVGALVSDRIGSRASGPVRVESA